MICHHCQSSNEQSAIFCSYCGEQLRHEREAPAEPAVVPALGSTIDLRRFQQAAPAQPAQPAQSAPPAIPRPATPVPQPVPRPVPRLPLAPTRRQHRHHRPHGWQWNALIGISVIAFFGGIKVAFFLLAVLGALALSGQGLPNLLRGLMWLMGMVVFVLGGMVFLGVLTSLGGGILPAIALIWMGTKLLK